MTRLLKTHALVALVLAGGIAWSGETAHAAARSVAVTPITSPVRLASVPHNVFHPARRIPLRWSFYLVLLDEIDLICPLEVEEVNEGRLSFSGASAGCLDDRKPSRRIVLLLASVEVPPPQAKSLYRNLQRFRC